LPTYLLLIQSINKLKDNNFLFCSINLIKFVLNFNNLSYSTILNLASRLIYKKLPS
jgi:hypothetical protein